ncbi:MAG: M20 family metallopeptidase [Actinomycetota bacterium]
MEAALVSLLKTPTQVPLGATEIAPGDERIVRAVEDVVLPLVYEIGPDEIRRHPMGDVAARFGPAGDDGILVQTYIVSQHSNLMDEAAEGSLIDGSSLGLEGLCAVGRGATQNKGPMASAFAALEALEGDLRRPIWLAVNTEGRSSHAGSRRIIDELGIAATHGLVVFGTDMRVSLGNRGRVDVEITLRGKAAHSSQPWLGDNPIESAADVAVSLRSLPLPGEHPFLGPATATPYQFACFPIAPHTIPEEVKIVVDRRLLPEETAARAVEAIEQHLHGHGLETAEVRQGAAMLPAIVDEDAPVVRALRDAVRDERGTLGETFWSLNAFDAGYACSKGIPSPMFGPGKRHFTGAGLIGDDAIPVDDCITAARILRRALLQLCA